MSTVRVEPRVTWPRAVTPGEPFLVSVDLVLADDAEVWPFEDEEIEFTCVLDGSPHFRVEAVHDASVVMHRFGGSYGPARFVVVAHEQASHRVLRLTPVTSRGIVMGSLELPVAVGLSGQDQGDEGEFRLMDLARTAELTSPATLSERSALCIVVGSHTRGSGFAELPGVYAAGQRVVDGLQALGYTCRHVVDPSAAETFDELQRFLTDDETPLRIVYFGGHGVVHDGDFFFAARDTRAGTSREARLVPFDFLRRMDGSRSEGHPALFLLDACFSGSAALSAEPASPLLAGTSPASRTGSYVVASSGSTDVSYNSLFSDSLADVLELAAAGRLTTGQPGGALPLREFVRQISRRMEERAPHLPQRPTATLELSRSADPAFIPVLAPAEIIEHTASTRSLRVVGVHGVGNQQLGPDTIAMRWLPIIQDNLRQTNPSVDSSAIDLSIAYYADLLAQPYMQGGTSPVDEGESNGDGEGRHGLGRDEDAEILADQSVVAEDYSEQPRHKASSFVRRALDYLARAQGSTSRPLQQGMLSVVQELNRYLAYEPRDLIAGRVHQTFINARPRAVLAHSLGSVVAYEALWREPYPEVELLVTMGSPLAFPPVLDRLVPSERGRPPGVSRWLDLSDTRDFIAIPIDGVAQAFPGADGISISTGLRTPHAVTSYLQSTEMATALADLLRRPQS